MALLDTTAIDTNAIDELARLDQTVARSVDSELAWDVRLRAELDRVTPRVGGRRAPLTMVDPASAPESIREGVTFWRDLPDRLDDVIGGRWPARRDLPGRTAPRLALLAWRCDADNERRRLWIDDVQGTDADPYVIALLRDRTHSLATGEQLYGTLAIWGKDGSRPHVPIADAGRLAARRAALGLAPIEVDAAKHLTHLVLLRRLGVYAGFAATASATCSAFAR